MACLVHNDRVRIHVSPALAIIRIAADLPQDQPGLRRIAEFVCDQAVRPLALIDLAHLHTASAELLVTLLRVYVGLEAEGARVAFCGAPGDDHAITRALRRHNITVLNSGIDQHTVGDLQQRFLQQPPAPHSPLRWRRRRSERSGSTTDNTDRGSGAATATISRQCLGRPMKQTAGSSCGPQRVGA